MSTNDYIRDVIISSTKKENYQTGLMLWLDLIGKISLYCGVTGSLSVPVKRLKIGLFLSVLNSVLKTVKFLTS